MKPTLFIVLFMLGFLTKTVSSSCTEFLQECTNCNAAHSCGPYREMKTNMTKCECIDMLETAGNTMVEYDSNQGICKSFNLCQGREEAMGYNTFIKSCRTDCQQYTIETNSQHSGSCYEISRVSVGYTYVCLQFCLHRDGCLAITYTTYSAGLILCTFHNCTQSVPETMNNSTFIGITCSGIGVASVENLPCHISHTSQGPTTISPMLTLIQTTFASSETPLSSAEPLDLMTSVTIHETSAPSIRAPTTVALRPVATAGSASISMTTTPPTTKPLVSSTPHTTAITVVMISTMSSPAGTTIIATDNYTANGNGNFFSKPSNIAAVSAAGGVAAVGGLSASACLMMKKSKLTIPNIN